MIALRWALLAGMVSCAIAVAVTGRWNGVALLQILFLAAYFLTFQNAREAVGLLLGISSWVEDDPEPQPSCVDALDSARR